MDCSSRSAGAIALALLVLLVACGCEDVPTFQELTGGDDAVEGRAPEQRVVAQDVEALQRPAQTVTSVIRSPQQIIDEFLATDTRIRSNKQLEELAALDDDVLSQLTSLDLEESRITDGAAKLFVEFPALEELNLRKTAITNNAMPDVAKVPGLRKLYCDEMIIDGAGVAALADHEQMQELSLSNTAISDSAFQHLQKMDGLEVLHAAGIRTLQGHEFAALAKGNVLQNLKELQVSSTGFGYYGLDNLQNTPALEVLIARDATVTDKSMPSITSCRNLRQLDLSQNPIGDEGAKLLVKLRQLESLKLSRCQGISEQGLTAIAKMKWLKTLELNGCRFSRTDVQTLKDKFLPQTEIHFDNEVF